MPYHSLYYCVQKETIRLKTEPKRSVFSFFYHFLGNFTVLIHIFTDFVEK